MLYAQIKKAADNKQVYKTNDNCHYYPVITLVDHELYTMSEVKKYSIPEKFYDIVNYPKNKTYFFFGCRYNDNQQYVFNEITGEKIKEL